MRLVKFHWIRFFYLGIAVTLLLFGFMHGIKSSAIDYSSFLADDMPQAKSFDLVLENGNGAVYLAKDAGGQEVGYITATLSTGYGGPMLVLVNWTLDTSITQVSSPLNHEDKPWLNSLIKAKYFQQYEGRTYNQPLQNGIDIDAVSGATISSNGVVMGVQQGRQLLATHLNLTFEQLKEPIYVGAGEFALAFGLLGVVGLRTIPALKRRSSLRYFCLVYAFIVIGVWLSVPLSMTNIASWLVGYAPHLQTAFIFYILIVGTVGVAIVMGKNHYCYWACPFAAVQECMHLVSPVRFKIDPRKANLLKNGRYFILFVALLLVLWYRNPSISVFEPWNVLFSFKGIGVQWALMIFGIVAAFFFHNFWCYYMCPVGAIMELILKVRGGVNRLWTKLTVRQNKMPAH